MKAVKRYINEYTQSEFNSKEACRRAELKSKTVAKLFKFWKKAKEDKNCKFANGYWCYQRTKKEFDKLIKTIILAVKQLEPWIYSQYKEGLKREYVIGHSFLGRYLDDGGSELYYWWGVQGNICSKCFREYGQMFYANNCKCNGTVKYYSSFKKIPIKTFNSIKNKRRNKCLNLKK